MRPLPALLCLSVAAIVVFFVLRSRGSSAEKQSSNENRPQPNLATAPNPFLDHTYAVAPKKTTTVRTVRSFSARTKPTLDSAATTTARRKSFRGAIGDQLKAVEPAITKCLDRHRGQKGINGRADVTFIVAADSDGALTIETTGIDFDHSSVTNEPLLGCLKDTAKAMTFETIPTGVNAVSVTRSIVIERGTLAKHRLSEYANLRDREVPLRNGSTK